MVHDEFIHTRSIFTIVKHFQSDHAFMVSYHVTKATQKHMFTTQLEAIIKLQSSTNNIARLGKINIIFESGKLTNLASPQE